MKTVGYMLLRTDGKIEGFSKEIINLLRFDIRYWKKKNLTIKDIFPTIYDNIHPYKERGMYKLNVTEAFTYFTDTGFEKRF